MYRTADAILRMRRFYRDINSDPPQVRDLPSNMISSTYALPYGYFDRPHVLHKVAIALLERFQQDTNLDDLKKSIELNKEAMHLIPDGHEDRTGIVACLGRSFLRRIEVLGELTDVDMLADLVELGERVFVALDNLTSRKEELREQIVLILLANAAVQFSEQEVPLPHIPATRIQSLVDEWGKDGIQTRCKRQLGVLLSFWEAKGKPRCTHCWRMWPGTGRSRNTRPKKLGKSCRTTCVTSKILSQRSWDSGWYHPRYALLDRLG